ncbi:MAG: DUF4126 domain-containing protein [Thermoleophilia bacterium]
MTQLLFALGRMIGLGTCAGVRPSLTLAVIGMMYHLHAGTALNPVFDFLSNWVAILVFVVLGLVEAGVDKIPRFDRVQSRLTLPYRVVMGGVAGAATIPYGWPGMAVGGVVGAGAAWFALETKQGARPKTVPSDAVLVLMSIWEDVASCLAAVATLALPGFGYLTLAFTAVAQGRTRYLYRAKYRRMQKKGTGAGGGVSVGQPRQHGS